jgi:hypothetical protein
MYCEHRDKKLSAIVHANGDRITLGYSESRLESISESIGVSIYFGVTVIPPLTYTPSLVTVGTGMTRKDILKNGIRSR